jgi:hypothetical protein
MERVGRVETHLDTFSMRRLGRDTSVAAAR